ncbi:hypothetical protein HZB02_02720 [Candidatus Woesearchaeota archaeon]|nr:hypothetical protein [Candidatus Woesearchaeota archaeon]
MGRFKELAQTGSGFFQSTFSPVYRLNDIPEDDNPTKKWYYIMVLIRKQLVEN